jgi:xanthine dehydrogenase accessory factor
MDNDPLVIVRGGGDLGSGVAHRLFRSGYRVLVLEAEAPSVVRRAAAFGRAVFEGEATVEGVRGVLIRPDAGEDPAAAAARALRAGAGTGESEADVPVVVDPLGGTIRALVPAVVVDARMAKRNLGTSREDAAVTVGLGPGFKAGIDVDFVVETKRGHAMGRLVTRGEAAANTGVPGDVKGIGSARVTRSPAEGAFKAERSIGDLVREGEVVGRVGDEPVTAGIAGLLRGLVADGVHVAPGAKIGDVDPRGREVDPGEISDKARSVAGAVLEALMSRGILPCR